MHIKEKAEGVDCTFELATSSAVSPQIVEGPSPYLLLSASIYQSKSIAPSEGSVELHLTLQQLMHRVSSHAKRLGQSQGGDRTAVHGRASTFERCSKHFEDATCLRCLVSHASPFVPEPSMTDRQLRIRSYRMKLDEWRMWKNNSKTARRRTKTISRHRQPQAIVLSQSLAEASSSREPISPSPPLVDLPGSTPYFVLYGISVPLGPLDIAELLPLISSLSTKPNCGLELMLNKWKPDGSYFKAALNYLEENKANFRMKSHALGRSIFHLIDVAVASHEKYPLAKMCLKIDFEQAQHENWDLIPDWMREWREACASQTWKDMKICLFGLNSDIYRNSLFLCTALPLLAEQQLQKNWQKLEYWRDRGGLISTSEADQAKVYRQESMDILGSFKEDEFDIDPIWYKRFFQYHEPEDTKHRAYKNLQLDQGREYRQKFSQLKILHDSASSADGLVPNLLNAATGKLSQKW
jgi:hypothetical protein